MTNYYIVRVKPRKSSWKIKKVKTAEEAQEILKKAKSLHYERYTVSKRLKNPSTDVPLVSGYFSDECQVVEVEDLEVDYRIVGQNVVIYDKYIKAQKEKLKEDERE